MHLTAVSVPKYSELKNSNRPSGCLQGLLEKQRGAASENPVCKAVRSEFQTTRSGKDRGSKKPAGCPSPGFDSDSDQAINHQKDH